MAHLLIVPVPYEGFLGPNNPKYAECPEPNEKFGGAKLL